MIQPGFKSERSITLANGDVCQVFCEVIKPQLVPLFKCTCKEKSIEIIATTPTQAANSLLKKLDYRQINIGQAQFSLDFTEGNY